MNLLSCVFISILVSAICIAAISGENANSKKKGSKKEDKSQIFIDDSEGSGNGNPDGKTDTVYSGSGFGPDDEDAEIDEHIPSTRSKLPHNVKKLEEPHEDKNEQMLPMPVPKTTIPPVVTKAAETPIIEVNQKPHETEPANKIPEEKHPVEENVDKSAVDDNGNNHNGVYVVNTPDRDRTTSFFAQPGILAAVIGGAVVGLLCAILVVMFIVYRMRKKDEGSYPLEEMKRCPSTNPYLKPNHREFFA